MRHKTSLSLLLVAFLTGVALFVTARADEWDDLDEPVRSMPVDKTTDLPAASDDAASEPKAVPLPLRSSDRTLPYAMIIFLGLSMVVAVVGGRANAKRMVAFEEAFCSEPDGLLRKHFSRLGKGQGQLLVNESSSTCKLHANGHQHLEGAVITLTMLRRHELVSYVTQKIGQQEDVLCMEMYVKEGDMPLMVMAIAMPSTHKELLRSHQDVKLLTQRLEVKEEKLREWPKEDLIVYSEHPSYFYDMMTKPMLAQVFGAVAFRKLRRHFRGLQISSESNSSHRKVIRCWLTLPAAENMADLSTLLQAALAMVDQVASYSISAERQKQAEKARRDFAKQTGWKEPGTFAREVLDVSRSKQKRK